MKVTPILMKPDMVLATLREIENAIFGFFSSGIFWAIVLATAWLDRDIG